MRKPIVAAISSSFLGAVLWSAPAWGADVNRARPGALNYVEGQASIGNQVVNEKSIGFVELEPGQTLATQAGKAEVLLTPGVFLRVGDNSVAKMVSPNLTDTEVELLLGSATVEVTDIHKENNLRVIEDGKSVELVKLGLYGFDADHEQVRVFTGQADVMDASKNVKIKGGHQADFSREPVKTQKFDKQTFEATDLYRWTSLRSSYLAEDNADAARTYVVDSPGWWGNGWYWDPWFDAYTFIPGDGILWSPFGWGFYSPGFAYYAPVFFGGRYYHHFGADYHAWGPGYHYGMPYHNGHGVVYGARPTFAARGGGTPHGFTGGGFHGAAGGFHGGGLGGGFHR